MPGLLDDYAFTALACLDAYEATADLSYFKFAHAIADAMIARFYDATSGGFFDSEPAADGKSLGVLATRRKPLQDSPTPAGNPMAAIALMRLHHYTGDAGYRDKAEQTLETFAGVAEQFGIFAATYGIAVVHLLESPVQVVVIAEDGDEDAAEELYRGGGRAFCLQQEHAAIGGQSGGRGKSSTRVGGHDSQSSRPRLGKIFRGAVLGIRLPTARDRCSGIAERLEGGAAEELEGLAPRIQPSKKEG